MTTNDDPERLVVIDKEQWSVLKHVLEDTGLTKEQVLRKALEEFLKKLPPACTVFAFLALQGFSISM